MAESVDTFNDPNYSKEFFFTMNKMRKEGTLCDVTLNVDGRSFLAHKNILAASSEYFRGMLTSHLNQIYIEDISANIFESILDYMYTGNMEINEENVKELWRQFTNFKLFDARDMCANFLKKILKEQIKKNQNNESFRDLWKMRYDARCYNNTDLVATIEKLIGFDFKEFMKSTDFMELNVNELCDLIGSDNLFTESEETIFEAGINWIKFREEERINFLIEVFSKVRLNLLSKKFLVETVSNDHFIKESEQCRNLIHEHLNEEEEMTMENSRSRYKGETGEIYVIGGSFNKGTMEKYDPNADIWIEGKTIPSERTYMGIAVVENQIYILGGHIKDDYDDTSIVMVFDTETNEWSESCNMMFPRSNIAVAVNGNMIYVCGGNIRARVFSHVECFNSDINTWLNLPPMMTQRMAAAAVTLNDFIYVMGGFDANFGALNSVERFDPEIGSWQGVKQMSIKRAFFGAAILRGKIYVCGGENGEQIFAEVEVYDPNQDTWELDKPMNSKRTDLAVVSNMDKIWAIGGIQTVHVDDQYNALNTVEVYDPDTKKWSFKCPMTVMRKNHVACVVF